MPMKIYENLRKSMKIQKNPRKFTKIHENLRKSWKILENLGIYGGLNGSKSENVEISLVLPLLFEGSRAARLIQEQEQVSEPERF